LAALVAGPLGAWRPGLVAVIDVGFCVLVILINVIRPSAFPRCFARCHILGAIDSERRWGKSVGRGKAGMMGLGK